MNRCILLLSLVVLLFGCDKEPKDKVVIEVAPEKSIRGYPHVNPKDLAAVELGFQRRLSRPITFEFQDTPVEEAVSFLNQLCRVGIILDPRISAEGSNKSRITVSVKNMRMSDALTLVLSKADPELVYVIRPPLFITTKKLLDATVTLEIYDVVDLLGGSRPVKENDGAGKRLCSNIQEIITPGEEAPLASLEIHDGKLVAQQTPPNHRKIQALLAEKRKRESAQSPPQDK